MAVDCVDANLLIGPDAKGVAGILDVTVVRARRASGPGGCHPRAQMA